MIKPHGENLVDRVIKNRQRAKDEAQKLAQIEINKEQASDIENIATGVFSPLEGFMSYDELETVIFNMRLPDDTPWTIPILLDVSREIARNIDENYKIGLYVGDRLHSFLFVENKFEYNKEIIAKEVFGTKDSSHPGVNKIYNMGEVFLSGKVDLVEPMETAYEMYNLSPKETRVLFKEKGWKRIVGFQTRNVPHLGHEYIQKTALTFCDGLFINPLIGKKKKGDFRDEIILDAYKVLIENYYLKNNAVMSILQTPMRYAGPREAIHHAIMRKNFGCTHFIVGRDHAGVGNFYPPYAAWEIFDKFPDLEIEPLFFKSFFYCKRCGGVVNEKICPHGRDEIIEFSGTKIREMIQEGKIPPKELMRPEVAEVVLKHSEIFV